MQVDQHIQKVRSPIPETIPLAVLSLNGLVNPKVDCERAVLFVPLILDAVALEAMLAELPVAPNSFLPVIAAGIVLFMFAIRDIKVI